MDRSFFTDRVTDRLILRNVTPEDTGFFYRVFSHPVVTRHLVDHQPFSSPEDAEPWVEWYLNENPDHNRWIVTRKETGEQMGTCGFHNWNRTNNRVEIGYDLLPEYWGTGFIQEAVDAALGFAFDEMAVHRVEAYIHTGNDRSVNVVERLGFRREGILRDHLYSQDRYHDHFLYSLLQCEYGRR